MPNQSNQTINMQVYIVAVYQEYDSKFGFHAFSYDPTPYNKEYVLIGRQDIEVVVPPLDSLIPAYVNGLKDSQSKIRAEMHGKINEIQERINRCLALEYVPSTESTDKN